MSVHTLTIKYQLYIVTDCLISLQDLKGRNIAVNEDLHVRVRRKRLLIPSESVVFAILLK